jgi:D-alanyl-D-alanine carboxypeptidase
MIAEKASQKSFRDLVHELVIEPHGLTSTFYEASTYPESVIKRLAHGYRWMRAVFGGKVVPPKQQQEWTELVSTKTGEPIAMVSADNPEGFALGLAERILGPLGAQWFYEGESLGYRTIYVWIADQDLMITVQTNSHPPEGTDKLGDAINALYELVKK